MSITFTKEPSGTYPAYNDSFIEFASSLTGDNRAEITVYPVATFPNVFTIYPDGSGNYLFNLKEAVKVIFNANGFEDSNYDVSVYSKSITGINLNEQIDIEVFNDSTSESTTKYYDFFRAVKQFAEPIHTNQWQLLSYSVNGENNYLTYFEGFPFHFDILKVTSGSSITVKNLNSGNSTAAMTPTANDAFRVNIDKGGVNNWTDDSVLLLDSGLNNLELYEGASKKVDIFLTKKKICSGIYLKWWNRSGGFSHYLFDRFFVDQTRSLEIGKVLNDEFNNIDTATGNYKSIGKEVQGSYNVKAKFESQDYEILKDIFTSPLVQMYTSQTAYVLGSFIDVFVDGTFSYSNKRGVNEISLVVELPERITAKL